MDWIKPVLRALLVPAAILVTLGLSDSLFPELSLFVLFPLSAIAILVWIGIQLTHGAAALWRHDWIKAVISMLAIVVVILGAKPSVDALAMVSTYVHLAWFVSRDAIDPIAPDRREAGAEIFNWGAQGLVAGASEERYLIRDRGVRRDIGKMPFPNYPGAVISTRHMVGNYYLRVLYYP